MATIAREINKTLIPIEGAQPIELPSSLLDHSEFLFNRELSWLEFNRRVLDEALDKSQPLLERLKFLAIFSSNLDEFFMIRVSGLMEELDEQVTEKSPDGMTVAEQLKEICRRLHPMVDEQMRCLREEILPQLEESGITVKSYQHLEAAEKEEANEYFMKNVFPVLTPQSVDPSHPFPYISNRSLNLGLMVEASEAALGKAQSGGPGSIFARIKVPPTVPRLVPLGDTGARFTYLGSLIAANLSSMFPGVHTGHSHLFRVTRDADIEIRDDEAGDLLRLMEQHVRRRRFGDVVRLEVAASMPQEMVNYLMQSLEPAPDVVT
ncbi:MAG: hypothetical protein WKF84_00845 [Pyrinomonadaceae bacterium]